jgi:hypothetical protein
MGTMALWMSRIALFFITVVIPGAAGVGVLRDRHLSTPISIGVGFMLFSIAAIGFVYGVRKWKSPPVWASIFARVYHNRDW